MCNSGSLIEGIKCTNGLGPGSTCDQDDDCSGVINTDSEGNDTCFRNCSGNLFGLSWPFFGGIINKGKCEDLT